MTIHDELHGDRGNPKFTKEAKDSSISGKVQSSINQVERIPDQVGRSSVTFEAARGTHDRYNEAQQADKQRIEKRIIEEKARSEEKALRERERILKEKRIKEKICLEAEEKDRIRRFEEERERDTKIAQMTRDLQDREKAAALEQKRGAGLLGGASAGTIDTKTPFSGPNELWCTADSFRRQFGQRPVDDDPSLVSGRYN